MDGVGVKIPYDDELDPQQKYGAKSWSASKDTVPLIALLCFAMIGVIIAPAPSHTAVSTHVRSLRLAASAVMERVNTGNFMAVQAQRSLAPLLHMQVQLDASRGSLSHAVDTSHLVETKAKIKQSIEATKKAVTQAIDDLTKQLNTVPVRGRPPAQQVVDGGAIGDDEDPFNMNIENADDNPGPAYKQEPDPLDKLPFEEASRKRAEIVKEQFLYSWKAYEKYAWGKDELLPRAKKGKNWSKMSGSLGLTILDSLSTLHIMGCEDELKKATDWVKTSLNFDQDNSVSAFESTIRILGSLLSLYELTGEKDKILLQKATEIADRLLFAYNTTTGIPHATVNLRTHRHYNPQWTGSSSVLSEFGTVQLEMRTLSYHTKNPIYDMKATHIMSIIAARAPKDMLCPVYFSVHSHRWTTDHITLGALGDSFYEYLLKQWLLTAKTEEGYRDMYERSARAIVEKLYFESSPSKWGYVAEFERGDFYHKMDHLACFAGGMLALGAHELGGASKQKYMEIAAKLTETCYKMYSRQKSGISPEAVEFPGGMDFINSAGFYILRPEAMESMFYMWRLTKEKKYRQWGWNMFRSIMKFCKLDNGDGYAGVYQVNVDHPVHDNLMQSFWMAEMLKYSYLLFADDNAINLDEWVFNTEAHPLKIRKRDPMDVWLAYEKEHGSMPWLPPKLDGVAPIETEKMRKDRLELEKRGKKLQAAKDPFSEEEFEDDAGGEMVLKALESYIHRQGKHQQMPKREDVPAHSRNRFDDARKQAEKDSANIKREKQASRPSQEEVQRRLAAARESQNRHDIDTSPDTHEESDPRDHREVSPEERKKKIEEARRRRKLEAGK